MRQNVNEAKQVTSSIVIVIWKLKVPPYLGLGEADKVRRWKNEKIKEIEKKKEKGKTESSDI